MDQEIARGLMAAHRELASMVRVQSLAIGVLMQSLDPHKLEAVRYGLEALAEELESQGVSGDHCRAALRQYVNGEDSEDKRLFRLIHGGKSGG